MKKWIIAAACICVVNIVLGRPIEEFDLREFCGFRFNSPHSDSSDTNRFVEVDLEKPFRLFKKAELGYTSDNKLYSIGLKLQDRMMSSCGIAIPQLSKGATLGVTLEAMQEEHNDLVEWAETEYGIKFRKTKKLGEPAFYSFGNTNIRISVSRLNMFGANQLSFTVSDAQLLDKIMLAEQKEKEKKQKRERELSLRKNEFGRNKAEQAEFEKTVNLKLFWGFEFGESFENQPITFDARTLEQMKKGRSYLFPRGKLKKPFLQIEDVSLHIDRATSNLTMVSLKKAYSNVPLNERN